MSGEASNDHLKYSIMTHRNKNKTKNNKKQKSLPQISLPGTTKQLLRVLIIKQNSKLLPIYLLAFLWA